MVDKLDKPLKLETMNIAPIKTISEQIEMRITEWRETWDDGVWESIEFGIYLFWLELANIYSIYTKNLFLLQKEKGNVFLNERENYNSDRTTTTSVNKLFANEQAVVEAQEMRFKEMEMKIKSYNRIANFIKDKKIRELSEIKRQEMSVSDKFNSRQ